MKWTTDRPTVPGWYWVRARKGSKEMVFEVLHEHGSRGLVLDAFGRPNIPLALFGEWSGPLTPPEDDADAKDERTIARALNDTQNWGED